MISFGRRTSTPTYRYVYVSYGQVSVPRTRGGGMGLYDGLPVRRMLAWDSPRVAKQLSKKARGQARVRIELIRTLEELLATEHAGSKKE